ncbi:hypothetical protein Dimus_018680 [Dionaea muscipula]
MSSFQFWVETPVHGNGGQVSTTDFVTHTEDDNRPPTDVPLPSIATIMSPATIMPPAIIQPITSDAVTGSISNDDPPVAINVAISSLGILEPAHGTELVSVVPAITHSNPTTSLPAHSMVTRAKSAFHNHDILPFCNHS